jgi:hypothetical protein
MQIWSNELEIYQKYLTNEQLDQIDNNYNDIR